MTLGGNVPPLSTLAFAGQRLALAHPHSPLASLLPALVPVAALIIALDVYCLVDLVRAKSVQGPPKIVWAVLILFVSAPLGAVIYLFVGRQRRQQAPDPASHATGVLQPLAASGHGPAQPVSAEPQPGAQPILRTSGLTRDYGGRGLFDVDIAVPRGAVYGLVGLNGAGKTTLLSIVSGVRRASSGSVHLDVPRSRVAVCPDVPEFDGWLTGYEVVDLARSLIAPAEGQQAVHAALQAAGLADSASRRVAGYSRGMLQRLGLAGALVGDPDLLILDEPTSALDPAGRAEMLAVVAAMRGRRTVIFSSHILADVQRVADQVGILRDGRLLYQGLTQELIDTYLKPSWLLRVAGDLTPVSVAFSGQAWVTRVEAVGPDSLRIDATTIEAGERGIPAVVAGCAARQVSCEPAESDLESAFLALTSGAEVSA
jgi:ABC-2 type transport system ATP-binding protein